MKKLLAIIVWCLFIVNAAAQQPAPPDKIYGQLFTLNYLKI